MIERVAHFHDRATTTAVRWGAAPPGPCYAAFKVHNRCEDKFKEALRELQVRLISDRRKP